MDFRATCSDGKHAERERLAFHSELDGHPLADRVRIGDTRQSPGSADFAFVRAL